MTEGLEPKFSYEDMQIWYAPYTRKVLEPAKTQLLRLLGEVLDPIVAVLGEGRVRTPMGRVKGSLRLYVKVGREKYVARCLTPEDIPLQVDDLIGLRVVCTHNSDLDDLVEALTKLPVVAEQTSDGLAVERGSARDYITEPKDSGYRAYHLNLVTPVATPDGLVPVRAELQVRTLLQDGWGELTHEDTYKPDQPVSRIVHVLARRMGELLATVDDIGQDIQNELTAGLHVDEPSAQSETAEQADPEPPPVGDDFLDLLSREMQSFLASQERPVPLALLANHVQGIFGSDIRTSWFGHGTFKNLLQFLLPEEEVIPVGPSYLIPSGVTPDDSWAPSLLQYIEEHPTPPIAQGH